MLTLWLATVLAGKTRVDLEANGITTGNASLGAPALTVSGLVPIRPGGAWRIPVFEARPENAQPINLRANPIFAAAPRIGRPAVSQRHMLVAFDLTAGQPAADEPRLTRTFAKLDNAFWHLAA